MMIKIGKFILIFVICMFIVILISKSNNPDKNSERTLEKVKSCVEDYITSKGKVYSDEIVDRDDSFFVGGIGKLLKEFDVDKFTPEEFDIESLMNSVPDTCDVFGVKVFLEDDSININIYTEEDKFYMKENQ